MKKIYLFILVLAAGIAAKAQNSVVISGSLDTAISGKTIWINVWGCGSINTSTTTNSSGAFSYNLNLGSCNTAVIGITTVDCGGDTLFKSRPYDTLQNGDTLVFNFKYCDSICRSFSADFDFFSWPFQRNADFYQKAPGANKFRWDFGDGNGSTAPIPSHTYAASGIYTVWLVAEDTITGCIDSNYQYVNMFAFDSVYVEGQLDTALDSVTAILWSIGSTYNSLILYTDASGHYSGWFRVKDYTGIIWATVINCHGDTVAHSGNYTHYGDSLYFNHIYCPPFDPCKSFFAQYHGNTIGRTINVTNTSSFTANKYRWNFGDGNTSTLKNPSHTYAADGTYTLCLIAEDTIRGCSDTLCANITIDTKSTVWGHITLDSTSNPIDSGRCRIWLIKADSVGSDVLLTAIDSTNLTDSGVYTFSNVVMGKYLVKAALLSTSAYYTDYLPTYYTQAGLWSAANNVNVAANSFNQADITLIKGTNPGGPGFIGGFVSVGANKTGDPMENIEVLLLDGAGAPVTYTYTNTNGEYEFTSLAYGTYRVLVEIPGKPSEEYTVTLNATGPGSSNNNFDVNSKDIKKSATSSIGDVAKNELNMYPNPASSVVTILFEAAQRENAVISITDVTGKEVMNSTYALNEGKNNIDLDIKNINNGLYVVTITTGAGSYTGRITIRK